MDENAIFSLDPATNEIVWQGTAAGEKEIGAAFEMARQAFPAWANLPFEKRAAHLKQFRDLLKQKQDLMAETISIETGKPLWESSAEVAAMINKVDISMESYELRCADLRHQQGSLLSLTRHKPHGVVAVLGPYNFPGHLPNGHIVPALLAGNTAIFKPSELTPFTGELMVKIWHECGLPPGVLNLVQGGAETGKMLSSHHQLDGLFFTGSWPTGKSLLEQFSNHPEKILALEMGGNNPLVFNDVKNLDAAAYFTLQSAYITTGQRCTCARRLIIVEGENSDQFIETLFEQIKGITIGPYKQKPQPYMGPLISEKAAQKLLNAQQNLIELGGVPLHSMQLLKPGTGFINPGLIDVTGIQCPDEEYFGPFLQIMRVPSLEAAIREANNTTYGLAAGIFSDKQEIYQQFYRQIKAGIVNWNTQLTGASSSAPFGGIGRSGNFRPSAFYAADYCSYPVASLENEVLKLPEKISPGLYVKW